MLKHWTPGTSDWGASEWLAASAALGRFAGIQMRTLAALPETGVNADRAERNIELERVTVALAIEAAHYAHRAEEELETMAGFLMHPSDVIADRARANVVKFQTALIEAINGPDPRD